MIFLSDPETMRSVFTITHGKEKGTPTSGTGTEHVEVVEMQTRDAEVTEQKKAEEEGNPVIMKEVQLEQYENL